MKGELFLSFDICSSWGWCIYHPEGASWKEERVHFTTSEWKAFFLSCHLILLRAVNWVDGKQGQWSCEKHLYSSPLLHTVEKREGSFPKYTSAVPDTEVSNYCHQNESHNSHSDDKDAIFVSPKLYCRLHQAKALSGNCWVLCTAHYKQLLP